MPWAAGNTPCLPAFSVASVKGMARATTVLAILHRAWNLNINLKDAHPVLYEGCLAIHVHHLEQASKIDETLLNMKLSSRGSIRKRANVIQIVVMISNLYTHCLTDLSVFTRKWNAMSGRSDQILGKRAMSLRLLFESAPKDCPSKHIAPCLLSESTVVP